MSALFKRKGSSCCVVVGCSMRAGTNLISNVKMFSFPKNAERRKCWEIVLRRENWKATSCSKICNRHFITGKPADKNDRNNPDWAPSINMGYESESTKACPCETYTKKVKNVSCSNGEDKTRKWKKILLRRKINASVPKTQNITRTLMNCSDENSECFSADKICARNTPIKRICSSESRISETNKCTLNKENTNMNLIEQQNLSSTNENFTYKNLLRNLSLIKKPNIFWGISSHSNFIICARWNENYICEKEVVIENSLIVRVFLKEWEMNLSELMNITCINDISNLLEKVESYKIVKFQDLE